MGDIVDNKAALRTQVRARRAARSHSERQDYRDATAALLDTVLTALQHRPPAVFGYAATATEPDPCDLLAKLRRAGVDVWYPRCVGPRQMEWVCNPEAMAVRPRPPRVPEPIGPAGPPDPWTQATLAIIPALAIDRGGYRLGQGGGFYDGFLSRKPEGSHVLALTFADEYLPAIPREAHDQSVDAAFCGEAIIAFNAP